MNQESLFTSEVNIDKSKEELFGMPDQKTLFSYSLGGNFHQLSDQKINKLISLKFNGNPIALIRQLSNDLAVKESEQILLRKEMFLREQELIKLCAEYGNLSRLEIDNKLKNLKLNETIDNTLSELIGDAINEDIHELQSDITMPVISPRVNGMNTNIENNESCQLVKDEPLIPKENRSNGWLSYWLSSSEDLISDSSKPNANVKVKVKSKSFSNILTSLPHISRNAHPLSNFDNRVPVELESIDTNDNRFKFNNNRQMNIDKYGFLNDVDIIRTKQPIVKFNTQKKAPVNYSNNSDQLNEISILNSSATNLVVDLDITGTASTSSNNHTIDLLREIGKLHDAKNQELEHQWDIFFKEILREIYKKDIFDNDYMVQNSLFISSTNDTRLTNTSISGILNKKSKHFKTLCNLTNSTGIPTKHRYSLWLELSGATNLKVNGEFERLYQIATQTEDKIILSHLRQIDLDIHRTMPSNIYFHDIVNSQPGPHLNKLKKILYAFATYKNDIGYSQGMNKIVGNLLLMDTRLTEEDVFWIFIGLIENILPHYNETISYFDTRSLSFIHTDQMIMKEVYFPRLMPKLARHFQTLNIQLEFITINWWLSLFTDNFLNIDIWFKIFDTLLVSDVELKLISLSLAMFKALEKFLINIKDQNGIYLAMKDLKHNNFTKTNLKYSELMEISNQIEKRINKDELNYLRKSYLTRK